VIRLFLVYCIVLGLVRPFSSVAEFVRIRMNRGESEFSRIRLRVAGTDGLGPTSELARIIRNPKRKRGNPGILLAYASGYDARRFG
jgi:hypothetical protein